MQPKIDRNLNVTTAPLSRGMGFWTNRYAAGVTQKELLNTATELYHRCDPVSQQIIVQFFDEKYDYKFVPPSTGVYAPAKDVLNSLKREVAAKAQDLNTANDTIAELQRSLAKLTVKTKKEK